MSSGNILPKGVANFNVINDFDYNLAEFYDSRIESIIYNEASAAYNEAEQKVDMHLASLNQNDKDNSLEDDYNDLLSTAKKISYKAGFDDGICFIMRSLLKS